MKDITEETEDKSRLDKLKEDTYRTTDEVIGKHRMLISTQAPDFSSFIFLSSTAFPSEATM